MLLGLDCRSLLVGQPRGQITQQDHVCRWAEEAAMWLACVNEVDMEQKAMGAAMQESLVEAEAHKQLEIPVHEQSQEQLKLRYDRSKILNQVQHDSCSLLLHMYAKWHMALPMLASSVD